MINSGMKTYTVKVSDNGDKHWFLNDKLHREDGPACEYVDGTKKWYLNDEKLSEAEFNARTKQKPADEYPMSCRLQDEANAQWVAALPAALAAERERQRVLREALEKVREVVTPPKGRRNTRDGHIEAIAYIALAATKEGSK